MERVQDSNRLTAWQTLVTLGAISYIGLNLAPVGEPMFKFNLNSLVSVVLSILTAVSAWVVWRSVPVENDHGKIMAGLLVGIGLWAAAELWWGVAGFLGAEVPYPSWADFFWIIGYVAMGIALWLRLRKLPHINSLRLSLGLGFTILVIVAWVVPVILLPILQNFDSQNLLESGLTLLYPIVDLIILVLVLRIFFTFQEGMYGRAWSWLTAGFALISFSDLVFSYASNANLYYPDGQATFLSILGVDIPYSFGYLCLFTAFMTLRTMNQAYTQQLAEDSPNLPVIPNTHVLVNTLKDNRVFQVSGNFPCVFPASEPTGMALDEALGIEPEETQRLIDEIHKKGVLGEQEQMLRTAWGPAPARVSGIRLTNAEGHYSGVSLLIRITTDDPTLDEHLTEYQKGMAGFLAKKTGNQEEEEIKQYLITYYQAYLQAFYKRILSEGGSILADAFFSEMALAARKHGWDLKLQKQDLQSLKALPLATVQEALPLLLETAQDFVSRSVGPSVAHSIRLDIASRFNEAQRRFVTQYQTYRLENN